MDAVGVALADRGAVQVAMSLKDFRETSPGTAFEEVRRRAAAAGVEVLESQIVGVVPAAAVQHSLVDPMANHILERVNASTLFLGCNGVHPEGGITNVNLPESAVKQHMLQAAQRCVVVAEGSKIGNISVVKIADIDTVDVLVTGSSAPEEVLNELADRGPVVEVAKQSETEEPSSSVKEDQ